MTSLMLKSLILMVFVTLSLKAYGDLQEWWCIADPNAPDYVVQGALDWVCSTTGGAADCTNIQWNQPCYLPNTVKDHASYAFNNYYQRFKSQGASCYFNGAAYLTPNDPSYGACIFDYIP
ncbi:glucan endo-1,3-beta-glucosidase 4-like [Cicer arietinum]|uniref:Glucan endo-1,3-beta-glucosidase 4-like n=1 Tax=Cicer arietinum TaxID=3827 RepID=A0A1S3EBT0_CICAR|nr:glucan endo-1,3-beta-glucosidase 4-like [Cicer arietinum]XP_012573285.1 glucan endo-1,3-beta-glucosidase 4-like [Cicer arietinum]XP_012573286.1 glucan endo-1,3-beta-glucosidase 4-like [Cicer arietinum]